MADNELLIKINANVTGVKQAYDEVAAKTQNLNDFLKDLGASAGVVFAAMAAEITFATKAFFDARESSNALTLALKNQGIFTAQLALQYKSYASEVSKATGLDDDLIIGAQATGQAYLGQMQITKELTQAIADYAAFKKIDLATSAEILTKSIGTETNMLARQGLQFSDTATEAEKYDKVLQFVSARAGGAAAEANKARGGIDGLKTAFENLQEKLGEQFAPIIEKAVGYLTAFFNLVQENQTLVKFAAIAIGVTAAIAGIVAAVAAVGVAVVTLGPYIAALGITSATLATAAQVVAFLSVTLGLAIAARKEEMRARQDAYTDARRLDDQEMSAERAKLEEAKKLAEEKKKIEDSKVQIQRESNELLRLQNQNASEQLINLQQQEIATLTQLKQSQNAEEKQLLAQKLSEIRDLQAEQRALDKQKAELAQQDLLAVKAEYGLQDLELTRQQMAALRDAETTELKARRELAIEEATRKQQERAQFLKDEIKHGEAYAKIKKFMNSEEVKGATQAAGELVQLQQSKNTELREIGKAAALVQIGIQTATSAMSVFDGFVKTIPGPVGVALGIAGAAAATAFGVEKAGQVAGFADGGLVTGGIPGRDSVPAMLAPGELVVPKQNFNDVVGAVRGDNAGIQNGPEILAALQSIDQKISTPQTTVINGDVMADDSYVDAFIRKISDAVEFRNAQIFGVT